MLVPMFVSACKLNELNSVLEPETGAGQVYSLAAVNDKAVPVSLTQGNVVFEIQKGALTLATDSTWIISLVIRQQSAGTMQRTVSTQRGAYRQPAQPTTTIVLSSSADSTAIFSGTYSTAVVALTDVSVPQGDRLRFTRP
jgi:hypothetical protein